MISREEADQIAAVWAQRDSVRRGYECTPALHEFELGYLIWSRQPAGVVLQPDDGGTTVVDKQTGEVATYPALPPQAVERQYRQHRAGRAERIHTADPAVELRRGITRLPVPTTAAHLTVGSDEAGYDLFLARGAKGETDLRHHRLVRSFLQTLRPGQIERGGERHAEVIVLSDALHEHDRRRAERGLSPMSLQEAQALLRGARLELFRVREPGDPVAGPPEQPAQWAIQPLVHFGVIPADFLAYTEEYRASRIPPGIPLPDPARFPGEVGRELAGAGWDPSLPYPLLAEIGVAKAAEHGHEPFPAALRALSHFPGLVTLRSGPGEQVWIRHLHLDPRELIHNKDTLADFARVLGARLFPLGTEGGDSILAVDEHGRIFALDQAGEWFLGADIDAAIITLLRGLAPRRVLDDGTW